MKPFFVSPDLNAADQARVGRVEQNGDSLRSALAIIVDLTIFTVGPGEAEEYEHVDLHHRCAEMSAFYHWWVGNLIFDATDYEWKSDYADAIAMALCAHFPPLEAVLSARWREYEGDSSQSMSEKAAAATPRVLHYIDPYVPAPEQLAHDVATEGTRLATQWFRERTTWT